MTEGVPIGYRVKGARAVYDETLEQYDVISEELSTGAAIERDNDGKVFFETEKQAMDFAFLQMLYHAVIEPIYEN